MVPRSICHACDFTSPVSLKVHAIKSPIKKFKYALESGICEKEYQSTTDISKIGTFGNRLKLNTASRTHPTTFASKCVYIPLSPIHSFSVFSKYSKCIFQNYLDCKLNQFIWRNSRTPSKVSNIWTAFFCWIERKIFEIRLRFNIQNALFVYIRCVRNELSSAQLCI